MVRPAVESGKGRDGTPWVMMDGRLPQTPGYYLGLPSREVDPELRPYGLRGQGGRRGALDALDQQSRVSVASRRLREGLASAQLDIAGLDLEDPTQVAWQSTALDALGAMMADRDNPGQTGTSSVLRQLADEWLRGVYLASWAWVTDPHAPLGARLELFQIPSSTIVRWDTDALGWRGVWYSTSDRAQKYVSREDLVYVRTRGSASQLEGEPITRPLIFVVDCWRETAKAVLMAQSMGSGLIVATSPTTGSSDGDWETVRDMLIAIEQGTRRTVQLPHGWTMDVQFPAAGASAGSVEILSYWDAQIDHALDSAMSSLGFSANGSRALGETMGDDDRDKRLSSMGTLLSAFGSSVLPIIAERVGYDGLLGELVPTLPEELDVSGLIETVTAAKSAGLIRWGKVRADWLASQIHGLPDEPEDTEEPPPDLPATLKAHSHGPSCTHTLAARQIVTVTDYDGQIFEAPRELMGIERLVSWVRLEAEYGSAREFLERAVGDIADRQRAALGRVLRETDPTDWTIDTSTATDRAFLAQYAEAIRLAVEEVARSTAQAANEEARRQGAEPGSGSMVGAGEILSEVEAEVSAAVMRAAESIASRVTGEIETYWIDGGPLEAFVPDQTNKGLAREADGALHIVASRGRVLVAVRSVDTTQDEDPLVPVEADRVEVLDKNLCQPCADRGANGVNPVVLDLTVPNWREVLRQNPLPDVINCEGGAACRCTWLVRWARLSTLPLDVQTRYRVPF